MKKSGKCQSKITNNIVYDKKCSRKRRRKCRRSRYCRWSKTGGSGVGSGSGSGSQDKPTFNKEYLKQMLSSPESVQSLQQCVQGYGTGKGTNINCSSLKNFNKCEIETDGACVWKHNAPVQKELKKSMRAGIKKEISRQRSTKTRSQGVTLKTCGSGAGSMDCVKAKACSGLGSGKGSFIGSGNPPPPPFSWNNGSNECAAAYPNVEKFGLLPINVQKGGNLSRKKFANKKFSKATMKYLKNLNNRLSNSQYGGSGSGSGSGSDQGSGWIPDGYSFTCPFTSPKKCEGECKTFDRDVGKNGVPIYGRACANPVREDPFLCQLPYQGKQLCRWEYKKDIHPIHEPLESLGSINPDYIDDKGYPRAGCTFASSPLWAAACGMNLDQSTCSRMGHEIDDKTGEKLSKCKWESACIADPNGPRTLENYQRCANHRTADLCNAQRDTNFEKKTYQCVWQSK